MTYRWRGHYEAPGLADLRPPEEIEAWKKKDPIPAFEQKLLKDKVATRQVLEDINKGVMQEIQAAVDYALASPLPAPRGRPGRRFFRIIKHRKRGPMMRKITYEQAGAEALMEEFRRDPKTIHLATDIAADLRAEFGEARVRQTPIAESSFVGAAIGLAGSGYRPVVNVRMATFGFVAMDQFINQAAKITYMFGGQTKFPIVYRMTVGASKSFAAQHSISPYSMYMNCPGLKIILPSTQYACQRP